MNPVAALAALFLRHLEHTPAPRMAQFAWQPRRWLGARRARGALPPSDRAAAECRAARGKTLRHRFTGQVRSVALLPDRVEFMQDAPGRPRSMSRSFVAAAKWLRNAQVVA